MGLFLAMAAACQPVLPLFSSSWINMSASRLDPGGDFFYNAGQMLLATPAYKVFFTMVLPLAALACLCVAVALFYRGLVQLVRRAYVLHTGLHAASVLQRGRGYVPVFSYVCTQGKEVDILGSEEYETEEEALRARRSPVYELERPDAPMARNAFCYLTTPVLMLVLSCLLAAASHYLLVLVPS